MTLLTPLTAVAAAALLALGPLSQQRAATTPPQTAAKAAVVSLVGCVERVGTPPDAGATPRTSQTPAYKLIDVQPGPGTTAALKPDSQFLLSVSTSLTTPIDFSKFQNQWVELTGTISPAPAVNAKVTPQAPRPTGETATLPTFTTASLKVMSTECR